MSQHPADAGSGRVPAVSETVDDAFFALIASDPDLLRAEFDELVDAAWGPPPDPPAEPGQPSVPRPFVRSRCAHARRPGVAPPPGSPSRSERSPPRRYRPHQVGALHEPAVPAGAVPRARWSGPVRGTNRWPERDRFGCGSAWLSPRRPRPPAAPTGGSTRPRRPTAAPGLVALAIVFPPVAAVLGVFAVGYAAMVSLIPNGGAFYALITPGLGKQAGVAAAVVTWVGYSCFAMALLGSSGEAIEAAFPHIRIAAWQNRGFLRRAVAHLAESGITQ